MMNRTETNAENSQEQRQLSELYAFLAALNRTLLAHLSTVVSDYPICDMANVLEDYQKARDEIINVKCMSAARKVGLTSTLPARLSGTSSMAVSGKPTVDSVPNKTSPAVVSAAIGASSENTMQNAFKPTFIQNPNANKSAPTADSSNDVVMESDDTKPAFKSGNANFPTGFAFGKSADIMKISGTKFGGMEGSNVKKSDASISSLKCTNTSNLDTSDTTTAKNISVPQASTGFANVKPGVFMFAKPSTAGDNEENSSATGTQGFSFGGNATGVQSFALPKSPDTDNNNEKSKPLFANFGIQKTEGAALEKLDDLDANTSTEITSPQPPVSNTKPMFAFATTNAMKGEGSKPFVGFGSFAGSAPSGISTAGPSALGFGKTASFGATGFSFGASAVSTGDTINKSLPSGGEDKDKSGEDEVPAGEEESFKQNRTNDELVRKGAGEEDEESLYEIQCKVYKPSEEGGFTDLGKGIVKVNQNTKSNRRRLLCRQEGSGKVILNAPLFVGMSIQEMGVRDIGCPVFDDKGGISRWLVRVRSSDDAKNLKQFIDAQVALMKEEKEAAKKSQE